VAGRTRDEGLKMENRGGGKPGKSVSIQTEVGKLTVRLFRKQRRGVCRFSGSSIFRGETVYKSACMRGRGRSGKGARNVNQKISPWRGPSKHIPNCGKGGRPLQTAGRGKTKTELHRESNAFRQSYHATPLARWIRKGDNEAGRTNLE